MWSSWAQWYQPIGINNESSSRTFDSTSVNSRIKQYYNIQIIAYR